MLVWIFKRLLEFVAFLLFIMGARMVADGDFVAGGVMIVVALTLWKVGS